MAFVAPQTFTARTTTLVTPSSTTVRLSASDAAALLAVLGASGNFTTCTLSNGVTSEIVYPTGVVGTLVSMTRAHEGTVAGTYAIGSTLRFVWTEVSIQDVASGGTSGITIAGGGTAVVTGGPFNFTVTVAAGNLIAGTGIGVAGTWPNITITNTDPGGGGSTLVTGSGTAVVTPITGGYDVNVAAGSLTAGTGINITGTWPNFTITNSAPASGGSGTVTSVTAGTGISVTGTPTIAPVVGITPTGIAAGAYGAITVNAGGQITAIASNLLTSITSATASLIVSAPSSGVVTLTQNDSTTSTKGIIKTAVNSSVASSDPSDTTSAVSPSGVAAVLAAQTPVTVSADTTNIPLASASYTDTILTSSLSLNLASGKTAVVTAVIEEADPGDPTAIANFGIALFTGATFIDGNSDIVPGCIRTLVVKIAGPFTGVVVVKTTALVGAFVVQSKSINIVTN